MTLYKTVFAPIIGTTRDEGYLMPILDPATDEDVAVALVRLTQLWVTSNWKPLAQNRDRHHWQQVHPLAEGTPLLEALKFWFIKAISHDVGRAVCVVHGDPTIENIMAGGVWIDPSTRPMPLEAEFDGGKLLQSYFGYGEGCNDVVKEMIKVFLRTEHLDLDLCAYYLMTHLVRLYRVQPQAREWAVDLAVNLESRMEELCK